MIVAVIEKKGLEPENRLPVLNTEFSVLISNLATGHLLPEWKGLVPTQDRRAQQIHQNCSQW